MVREKEMEKNLSIVRNEKVREKIGLARMIHKIALDCFSPFHSIINYFFVSIFHYSKIMIIEYVICCWRNKKKKINKGIDDDEKNEKKSYFKPVLKSVLSHHHMLIHIDV